MNGLGGLKKIGYDKRKCEKMGQREEKTNAMRMLETEGIPYTVHRYDVKDGAVDGVSVAKKCGENEEQVFKTLVTIGSDRNHYVFVVPVGQKLDLKAAASAVKVKSVAMLPQKDLLKVTGYVHGGCSPVGMKKKWTTVLDETILLFDTVMVSGGRIGLQVELTPDALQRITDGKIAAISIEDMHENGEKKR